MQPVTVFIDSQGITPKTGGPSFRFLVFLEYLVREIPDHATFREKEATLGWLDKLGWFLSLALCNLTIFDQLYFPRNKKYHLF